MHPQNISFWYIELFHSLSWFETTHSLHQSTCIKKSLYLEFFTSLEPRTVLSHAMIILHHHLLLKEHYRAIIEILVFSELHWVTLEPSSVMHVTWYGFGDKLEMQTSKFNPLVRMLSSFINEHEAILLILF